MGPWGGGWGLPRGGPIGEKYQTFAENIYPPALREKEGLMSLGEEKEENSEKIWWRGGGGDL